MRDLSLKLFANGLSKEDTLVFQDFFNPTKRYDDLETSIRRFPLDKLKPLKNFITAKTSNPDEDIVKLLAILTSFTPRPFHKWREMRRSKNQPLEHEVTNAISIVSEIKPAEKPKVPLEQEDIESEEGLIEIDDIGNKKWEHSQRIAMPTDHREEVFLKNKYNKKGRLSREEIPREKPPSKRTSMKVHITFTNFQLRHVLYFFGIICGMIFLYAITQCLTFKQHMYWIAVQHITAENQPDQPYSKIITVGPEHPHKVTILTRSDTLTEATIPNLDIANCNNYTAFSTARGLQSIQETNALKEPKRYIILMHTAAAFIEKNGKEGP